MSTANEYIHEILKVDIQHKSHKKKNFAFLKLGLLTMV